MKECNGESDKVYIGEFTDNKLHNDKPITISPYNININTAYKTWLDSINNTINVG